MQQFCCIECDNEYETLPNGETVRRQSCCVCAKRTCYCIVFIVLLLIAVVVVVGLLAKNGVIAEASNNSTSVYEPLGRLQLYFGKSFLR